MARSDKKPQLFWQNKRSKFYIIWNEDGSRKERSTGTDDKGDAHEIFAEFLHRWEQRNVAKDPEYALITDAIADYIEDRSDNVVDSKRIGYGAKPLIFFWKGKTVAYITQHSCNEYTAFRKKPDENGKERSNGTVRRELGILRSSVNHAYNERRIKRSVTVYLPPKPPGKSRWLTKEEAARLVLGAKQCQKHSPYLLLFIKIGLYTGQRKTAILSLKWNQIDLNGKLIDWNQPGRIQTKKNRPIIRIPTKLISSLKTARLVANDNDYVINRNRKRLKDIKRSFASACKKASLIGVTPHVLRHTRATWGMQAGAQIWNLAGFLGMTPEVLEDTYGHHHPDFQNDVANTF